jgi:hypothetical protein
VDLTIEIQKEFEKIKMTLYSNGIMHVLFKKDALVELEDVREVVDWVESIGSGRKYANLMEAESNSEVDAEARAFAASNNQNQFTIADGMVMTSQAHKILSNFYLKFNKPVKPTKVFTSRAKAIQWLLKQKELYYKNS